MEVQLTEARMEIIRALALVERHLVPKCSNCGAGVNRPNCAAGFDPLSCGRHEQDDTMDGRVVWAYGKRVEV